MGVQILSKGMGGREIQTFLSNCIAGGAVNLCCHVSSLRSSFHFDSKKRKTEYRNRSRRSRRVLHQSWRRGREVLSSTTQHFVMGCCASQPADQRQQQPAKAAQQPPRDPIEQDRPSIADEAGAALSVNPLMSTVQPERNGNHDSPLGAAAAAIVAQRTSAPPLSTQVPVAQQFSQTKDGAAPSEQLVDDIEIMVAVASPINPISTPSTGFTPVRHSNSRASTGGSPSEALSRQTTREEDASLAAQLGGSVPESASFASEFTVVDRLDESGHFTSIPLVLCETSALVAEE